MKFPLEYHETSWNISFPMESRQMKHQCFRKFGKTHVHPPFQIATEFVLTHPASRCTSVLELPGSSGCSTPWSQPVVDWIESYWRYFVGFQWQSRPGICCGKWKCLSNPWDGWCRQPKWSGLDGHPQQGHRTRPSWICSCSAAAAPPCRSCGNIYFLHPFLLPLFDSHSLGRCQLLMKLLNRLKKQTLEQVVFFSEEKVRFNLQNSPKPG